MPTSAQSELERLLRPVREDLSIEVKGWLNFSDALNRATLAKALIAIANHGGGFVVVGFTRSADGYIESAGRPPSLIEYNDDAINGIVRGFALPQFHCSVHHIGGGSAGSFPIIVVPGGHKAPIQAAKGSSDNGKTLMSGRYYIRRPGPESAEPASPEEWRELISRCIRSNRSDLLDALRDVLSGQAEDASQPKVSALESLLAWANDGEQEWLANAPKSNDGRIIGPKGFLRIVYEIQGELPPIAVTELLEFLEKGAIRHTGWPVWVVLRRQGLAPYAKDGGLEAFLGSNDPSMYLEDPAHVDFWRAMPNGRFLLLRGLQEDGTDKVAPGTGIDLTLPAWRVGESLLHAASMCKHFGVTDANVLINVKYFGLQKRKLISLNWNRFAPNDAVSHDNMVANTMVVNGAQIEDGLPEILHRLLRPLYNSFNLYDPGISFYTAEMKRMRENRF